MGLVRESINFKRGLEPKEALNVGMAKILTPPFEEALIPPGLYKALALTELPELEKSSDDPDSYICIVEKMEDGDFYIRAEWSMVKDGVISYPNQKDKRFVRYNHRLGGFKDWTYRMEVSKLIPLSEEEFKEIFN